MFFDPNDKTATGCHRERQAAFLGYIKSFECIIRRITVGVNPVLTYCRYVVSVTQKINVLEKAGYVTRKQNPADKREYFLYFNADSFDADTQSIYTKLTNQISESMEQRYSKEEIEKFSEMLSYIGEICLDERL